MAIKLGRTFFLGHRFSKNNFQNSQKVYAEWLFSEQYHHEQENYTCITVAFTLCRLKTGSLNGTQVQEWDLWKMPDTKQVSLMEPLNQIKSIIATSI